MPSSLKYDNLDQSITYPLMQRKMPLRQHTVLLKGLFHQLIFHKAGGFARDLCKKKVKFTKLKHPDFYGPHFKNAGSYISQWHHSFEHPSLVNSHFFQTPNPPIRHDQPYRRYTTIFTGSVIFLEISQLIFMCTVGEAHLKHTVSMYEVSHTNLKNLSLKLTFIQREKKEQQRDAGAYLQKTQRLRKLYHS